MAFKTEYEFTLQKGIFDEQGNLHKRGLMRLATAADEILPLRDPRVQQNPAYQGIILLSRVITKIGDLSVINTGVIENLPIGDYNQALEFYREINSGEAMTVNTVCTKCGHEFETKVSFLGED